MTEDKDDQTDKPVAYIADLADFNPDPDNLNLHTQRGQAIVTQSQQKRGYARPAFAASDGTVLGGNLSTMEVAPDIGLGNGKVLVVETSGDIPIIHKRLDIESGSDEARLWAADDNRSSEVSLNWNPEQLLLDKEAGVDFSGLFYENEFDEITKDVEKEPPEEAPPSVDLAEEAQKLWQVKKGDVWQLDRHKIACKDSLNEDAVKALVDDETVGMVWADPPYGINVVAANSKGLGAIGGPKPFGSKKTNVRGSVGATNIIAVGKYYPIEGDDTTETACQGASLALQLFPEAIHFLWGGNYYTNVLTPSPCWIIWDKDNTGIFADCEMAWTNQPTAARIFEHRWNGMLKASEQGQRRVHPTQKPVALFEWTANKYFKDGGIVFDPFLGSGISVIGAENIGDKITVIGCELSPEYIAVIIQRWVDLTSRSPICVSSSL